MAAGAARGMRHLAALCLYIWSLRLPCSQAEGVGRLELSLFAGSSVAGGPAALWAFIIPSHLLSSSSSGDRAVIRLSAPAEYGFVFTDPCRIEPAFSDGSGLLPLPTGTACERSSQNAIGIYLPFSSWILAGAAYAFLVRSVRMPLDYGNSTSRRLDDHLDAGDDALTRCSSTGSARSATASLAFSCGSNATRMLASQAAAGDTGSGGLWSASTYGSDRLLRDTYYPAGVGFRPIVVPGLNDFAFTPSFASTAEPRFGVSYIAAFSFLVPSSFGTPVGYLRLSAPLGFTFDTQEDCSPDSTAAIVPMQNPPDEVDRSQLSGVSQVLPGWCHASPQSPLQRLLPLNNQTDVLLPSTWQSAELSLTQPIAIFSQRYMFRVRVRHPPRRADAGDATWSLALLDTRMQLIAQTTGLLAYSLVGDLQASLLPSNRVMSTPGREEAGSVAVSFQLTSHLPAGGRISLLLPALAAPSEAFRFRTPPSGRGSSTDACNVSLSPVDGTDVTDAALIPAVETVNCTASQLDLGFPLGGGSLLPGGRYVFWVDVINPRQQPPANATWTLLTYSPGGEELDGNRKVEPFSFVEAPLPLAAVAPWPGAALSERLTTVLVFFNMPNATLLPPHSELWVAAPQDFTINASLGCTQTSIGSSEGFSSMPSTLIQGATALWTSLSSSQPSQPHRAIPLPPLVACSVFTQEGRDVVRLVMPGRLVGGAVYALALDTVCPVSTPAGSGNVWVLQVWRKVNFQLRLAFQGAAPGFSLVPKSQQAPPPDVLASGMAPGASLATSLQLETQTAGGVLLDERDNLTPFQFALLAATSATVPGVFFNLAVIFSMPDVTLSAGAYAQTDDIKGLLEPSMATSIRLLAPPFFEFSECDGGPGDNARLASIPSVPTLQDSRALPGLLRPLPALSACAAHGSALWVALGGRRRGSGRGSLEKRATYAFTWSARVLAGRQTPFRPVPTADSAGEGVADLFLANEPASPPGMLGHRDRWALAALRGPRRVLASTVETFFEARGAADQTATAAASPGGTSASAASTSSPSASTGDIAGELRLQVRDVTPVWILPTLPYIGEKSIMFIIFSLGKRAYPSKLRLRVSAEALDPSVGSGISFLSCEEQTAIFRRHGWEDPLAYFDRSEAYWSQLPDSYVEFPTKPSGGGALTLVWFADGGCLVQQAQVAPPTASELAGDASMNTSNSVNYSSTPFQKVVAAWLSATSQRLTLQPQTLLVPPGSQFLLPVGVFHLPRAANSTKDPKDLITLELMDGAGENILSRSQDLAPYPLTRRMTLTRWAYSSVSAAAGSQLDLEFMPATDLLTTNEQPQVLGFILVAPAPFRFTQSSCTSLEVTRTEIVMDQIKGTNTTQKLFFLRDGPTCEVTRSEWFAEDRYYQHQLVIYMPTLVSILSSVYYRIQAPIHNPPLPAGDALYKQVLASQTSPKFSQSPYLAPLLNTWRLFTFVWEAGDAGGGAAPFLGATATASLGRVGGVRKVDEVVWGGFDILAT